MRKLEGSKEDGRTPTVPQTSYAAAAMLAATVAWVGVGALLVAVFVSKAGGWSAFLFGYGDDWESAERVRLLLCAPLAAYLLALAILFRAWATRR